MQIGFIVILIIAIFVAIFAIQNGTPVPVDLFFARYEMPLAVIMMICLILGAVIVLILGTTRQFKRRSEQKELNNKIKAFETEKTQFENNFKALETEKAKIENDIKTKETEIKNLKDNNSELSNKIEQLEERIIVEQETVTKLNEEINLLKTETENKIIDTIDEGVALIDNENSEVESQ